MAQLLAWYPLINDTHDQGTLHLPVTTSGTAVWEDGIIGGSITSPSDSAYTILRWTAAEAAQVYNNTSISIAFWVYVNADTGTALTHPEIIGNDAMGTTTANRKFSLFLYNNCNSLHWSWMNDTASQTYTNGVVANVIPSYTWTHVCITYDNPNGNIYINGELKRSFTGVSNSSSFANDTNMLKVNSQVRICDLRFYREALTADEVKDIARGLVLHYPLSREGFGQDNLCAGTKDFSGWNQTSNLGGGTISNIDDAYMGFTAKHIDARNSTAGYIDIYKSTLTVNPNDVFTCTFYCKSDVATSPYIFFYNNTSDHVQVVSAKLDGTAVSSGSDGHVLLQTTTSWKKHVVTWTFGSGNASVKTLLFRTFKGQDAYVCGFHLERGSIDTPWVPHSSDALFSSMGVNSTTVHDVSGFQHNGTSYGAISYSADTHRHEVSRVFNGSNNWITTAKKMDFIKEAVTLTFWANADNWASITGTPVSSVEGGGWGSQKWGNTTLSLQLGTGTSSLTWLQYSHNTSALSGWHHFAITYDGYVFKVYVDATEKYTSTQFTTKTPIYYNTNTTANALFIGGECGNSLTTPTDHFAGKVSDVRVYATALSAAEIQDIYKGVM